jgi:type IV secretion system protein VirB2
MNSPSRNPASLLTRSLAFLAAFSASAMASAQTTVGANAGGGNPLVDALNWMMNILLGPVATAVAVMAVAGVGFMMLTGRMNWRYGGTVIIGVFIIFGAPRLVNSISAF